MQVNLQRLQHSRKKRNKDNVGQEYLQPNRLKFPVSSPQNFITKSINLVINVM